MDFNRMSEIERLEVAIDAIKTLYNHVLLKIPMHKNDLTAKEFICRIQAHVDTLKAQLAKKLEETSKENDPT